MQGEMCIRDRENAHEAVIDRNDFDLVQRIRNLDTRTSPQKDKVYLFSGILVCGCCGSRMVRKTNRYKDKEYHYYYCPTGKKNGCAHPVMVKENELMECVRDSLKGFIANVVSLDEILSGIDQSRINRELIKEYSRQIAQNEQQLERIRQYKMKLYESMVNGFLDKSEFLYNKSSYSARIDVYKRQGMFLHFFFRHVFTLTMPVSKSCTRAFFFCFSCSMSCRSRPISRSAAERTSAMAVCSFVSGG